MTGLDSRGQAYTLEGVIGALLIATGVIFGLQAVDVAPWTQGTDDERVESVRTQAQDLLAVAADTGTLTDVVTCFDASGDPAPTIGRRKASESATQLGPMLNGTLYANGYRYNLYLRYYDDGVVESRHVHPSEKLLPDDGAVNVSRRVVLLDSTPIKGTGNGCAVGGKTLEGSADDIYLNATSESEVFNVVEVRLVVW